MLSHIFYSFIYFSWNIYLSLVTFLPPACSLSFRRGPASGGRRSRAAVQEDKIDRKLEGKGKSVGHLLMDQALFADPGNILRAEILFLAGVNLETAAGI